MTKKIKLIDRLKSWLVTLGIASVFGLAALGVNAANSYQKACAYEYQDNGTLVFSVIDYDCNLLLSYFKQVEFSSNLSENMYLCPIDFSFNGLNVVSHVAITYGDADYFYLGNSYDDWGNDVNYLIFEYTDGDGWHTSENYYSFDSDDFTTFSILPSYDGYQSLRNYSLSYNAPQESGNFITALTSFMSLIGGGIVQLAQSVGAGVVSFASGLFLDSGHLSILGGIIGIFAGIALAVGITSKVYAWVSTLGN